MALKKLGVTHIIATTACGSLRKEIDRGHLVVLDQFIDFTRFRKNTFFDSFAQGAHHTAMAHPFDESLRKKLYTSAQELGLPIASGRLCRDHRGAPLFNRCRVENVSPLGS